MPSMILSISPSSSDFLLPATEDKEWFQTWGLKKLSSWCCHLIIHCCLLFLLQPRVLELLEDDSSSLTVYTYQWFCGWLLREIHLVMNPKGNLNLAVVDFSGVKRNCKSIYSSPLILQWEHGGPETGVACPGSPSQETLAGPRLELKSPKTLQCFIKKEWLICVTAYLDFGHESHFNMSCYTTSLEYITNQLTLSKT